MEKNIVLIGFMGTGKSVVGIILAKKLKKKFVDMDYQIEQITHMSITDIFKHHGEIRFRSEEKLLVSKLSRQRNQVIATGGGVVLDQDNIRMFRQNGIIICLKASAEEIFKRVNRRKGTRPVLKKNYCVRDIEDMLKFRETFYSQADYQVNTNEKTPEQVSNEIILLLSEVNNQIQTKVN
ncbi:MAG: shikimate kinase [Syntrophomonadaceae bacterium]